MNQYADNEIPLSEFDKDRSAYLEPETFIKNIGLPEACVIVYYRSVIEALRKQGQIEQLCEMATVLTPVQVFQADFESHKVAVVSPHSVGAPVAAGLMEELIALGSRKFVVCGSAGCLKPDLERDSLVIPSGGVRDEGTSFHYIPPSRTVNCEAEVMHKLETVLRKHGVKYTTGLTWTTDAFYRETRKKVARRRVEGCLTVEMEYTAFQAVAKFRDVRFGEYLMVGDDLSGDQWDSRGFEDDCPARERLFWLAAEAALNL